MTNVLMSQLVPGDEINSRTGADRKEGIVELAASIKQAGLILPLAVRHHSVDGGSGREMFEIIDGHRRFAALQKLKWTEPVPVNVLVDNDDALAAARSLIANTERLPLHPVDQNDAVQRMSDAGMSSDKIMKMLGLSDLQFRRILALAKIAPKVRKAWREGKVTPEAARLFALQKDHKKQEAILKEFLAGKFYGTYELKGRLTDNARSAHQVIAFCGVERLVAAGCTIVEDLFAETEATRYLLTGDDEAGKVVRQKIEELIVELGVEGFDCEHGQDDNADYEAALDLPEYDDDEHKTVKDYFASLDKTKAEGLTWILDFGYHGLEVDGPYRRTVFRDAEPGAADEDDATEAKGPRATASEISPVSATKEPDGMTAALRQDVLGWRTEAYQGAYAGQGKAFLRLMLFAAGRPWFSGVRLLTATGFDRDLWQFDSSMILADEVATSYAPSISAHQDRDAKELSMLLADSDRLEDFLLGTFRSKAEEYFERSNMAAIRASLAAMGATAASNDLKKSALAKYAAREAITRSWLPPMLRVGLAEVPAPEADVVIAEIDDDVRAAIDAEQYDHADLA